ncbi:MAG: tetratricopeptide repeat protein [Elusimicrobiota bacterium]|jgi:tetratricopeptide (TPR) repeat protein|nr:tetratricopeptide repeat protein [Elusimicrobiota bacterium]
MKNIEYYENLLDNNKPDQVVKDLARQNTGGDAKLCFVLAEAQRMLGNFGKAIALYNKAIALYKKESAAPDYAETIIDMNLALAKCWRTLGDAKKAYELAAMARIAAQKNNLKDFEIQALQEAAMALRAGGRLTEAMQMLAKVLAYYEKEKDFAVRSFIHWALGGIERLRGNFQDGITHFGKAAALAQKAKDKPAEAYALCGFAGISRIAGDAAGCVANYLKAEKIFAKTDDTFGKAYTNCGMANGLRQLGRLPEALVRYAAADKLYAGIGDKVDLGFVKWGRADILRRQNKLPAALAELRKARKLFSGSDETRGQLLTEFALAQVLYALGRQAEAVKIYDVALARARKEGLYTYLEAYT